MKNDEIEKAVEAASGTHSGLTQYGEDLICRALLHLHALTAAPLPEELAEAERAADLQGDVSGERYHALMDKVFAGIRAQAAEIVALRTSRDAAEHRAEDDCADATRARQERDAALAERTAVRRLLYAADTESTEDAVRRVAATIERDHADLRAALDAASARALREWERAEEMERERDAYRAGMCDLVAAAHPHPVDHPTMTAALAKACKLLRDGPAAGGEP